MKKIIFALAVVTQIVGLYKWLGCTEIKSFMNLTSVNIVMQVEDYIHTDSGLSLGLVRLFHNKVIAYMINFLDKYLKYWDIRFLVNVLTLLGIFTFLYGMWYLFNSNLQQKMKLTTSAYLLSLPIPLVLKILPAHLQTLWLAVPLYLISLIGTWSFLQKRSSHIYIIIALIVLSIWWMVLINSEIAYYCVNSV